jgi:hypothetical protein
MASSPLLGELTRFLAEPDLSKILLSWSLLQNDRSEWFGITFTVILQISNMDYLQTAANVGNTWFRENGVLRFIILKSLFMCLITHF